MNVIICGAGEIGSHAAKVLADGGSSLTVVDVRADLLQGIEDTHDVATLKGNCANADVLKEAGASGAGLVLAATNSDEVNLLTASVAKALGARRCIARVQKVKAL